VNCLPGIPRYKSEVMSELGSTQPNVWSPNSELQSWDVSMADWASAGKNCQT
jgi:hypothetical protein